MIGWCRTMCTEWILRRLAVCTKTTYAISTVSQAPIWCMFQCFNINFITTMETNWLAFIKFNIYARGTHSMALSHAHPKHKHTHTRVDSTQWSTANISGLSLVYAKYREKAEQFYFDK